LAYKNNYLTFRYIGITANQSKKVKYRYILEGLDENWSAVTNRTSVTYGNLAPGCYTFNVKAMNSEGFWSKTNAYTFTIRPPWWKTYWFRISTIVIVCSLLIGFYRLRVTALKKQKDRLKKIISEKTVIVKNQNYELQTLNEELSTANEEMTFKNDELHKQRLELELALNHLQLTQKQLIQSEKLASIGILSSGIAHEINNPLNFIKGGCYGLENFLKQIIPDQKETIEPFFDAINTGVDRAANIVSSLAAYARIDDSDRTDCKINSIIDVCLMMLQNRLNDKVEIIKNYCKNECIIKGNEGKLHQAFLNILMNAEESIEEHGTITISTQVIDNFLITKVNDTGCGIAKENLNKILEPFFTTKDPGIGTGLGLSITYKIILEHSGFLEYSSEPGKGTTVTVKLPVTI
jgi:signal transduction histidine kinase